MEEDSGLAVPEKYEQWAFEYKRGYADGRWKADFTWSPQFRFERWDRYDAYKAGRRKGRNERKKAVTQSTEN